MACVITKYLYLNKNVVKPGEVITVNMRFGNNCWYPQLYEAYCYLDGSVVWHDWGFILPFTEEDATCKVVAPKQTGQHYITVKTNQEQDEGLPGKTATFLVTGQKPSDKGLLIVNTNPAGASIYINGSFAGYAPLTKWLDQGWYDIKAEMRGYQPAEKRVFVMMNKTTKVTFNLSKITNNMTPVLAAAIAGIAVGAGVYYMHEKGYIRRGYEYARERAGYLRSKAFQGKS